MGEANLIEVTDSNFEDVVLKSDITVVVDFWAEWCGPCRALAPVFKKLSDKFSGKVKFAKLNVDDNQEVPARYNVRSIPTVIIFKEGKVCDTVVGFDPLGFALRLENNLE